MIPSLHSGRLITLGLLIGLSGLAPGCLDPDFDAAEPTAVAVAPAWSPEGDSIAYVRVRSQLGATRWEEAATVRVVDIAQKRDRALVNGASPYREVAWSPDGRWLALGSESDGRRGTSCFSPPCVVVAELYLVSRDGRRMRRLTNNHADDFAPAWSPDGHRLAFISGRDRPAGERTWRDVYVTEIARGGLIRLTSDRALEVALTWLEPGRLEVEREDGTCSAISAETGRRASLPCPALATSGRVVAPRSRAVAWLSTKDRNGKTCYVDSGSETCLPNAEVYLRTPGGRTLRVTRTTSAESDLAWSPDGRRQAFASGEHVWIVNADGMRLRKVSDPD